MIASHVTLPVLTAAAAEIGVDMDTTSLTLTRHRVKLYPETPQDLYRSACKRCREQGRADRCRCRRKADEAGDAKYQRVAVDGSERRVNAVCWHGFRDFFRAVYRREPGARFATAMDTWKNSADFEARHRESGHRNIGSQMCPMSAAEACRCPESGDVGHSNHLAAWAAHAVAVPLFEPTSLITADMGVDDVLIRPEGIEVERWSTYNKRMNDLLMGRKGD